MLADELEQYNDTERFRDYVGQSLWHITTIEHLRTNEENTMPQYVLYAHPDDIPTEEKQTAEQIINNVLEKLR